MKCVTPHFLRSNVVYKFTCQRDSDLIYIGETQRHLGVRASEHLNIQDSNPTAVGKHIQDCTTCKQQLINGRLTANDFVILRSGNSKSEIEILESLIIRKLNPLLNKQLHGGSSVSLKVYI